jgi:hypothetical protein
MTPKYFVIREVGATDHKAFAVVSHGEAWTSANGYKRKVLFVDRWYEKEDDARADAHRSNYPDY